MFLKIKAILIDWIRRKKYKKNHYMARMMAVFLYKFLPIKTIEESSTVTIHPMHIERAEKSKIFLSNLKLSERAITLAFGDSMLDLSRKWIKEEIPEEFNFSIGGSVHDHVMHMVNELYPYLSHLNIKYIVIGTLGGNSLLTHNDINVTIEKSKNVLNHIRALFPTARIIVFGLPPVYEIYTTLNSFLFDSSIYQWIYNDINSVFLPLQKKYADNNNLLYPNPKLEKSSDGIHFSCYGSVIFCDQIARAKEVKPRSIID